MKTCKKCDVEKPVTEFNKNSAKSDGLQTQCRQCTKENSQRHYKGNAASYKSRNKEYRKANMLRFLEFMSDKCCLDCGVSDVRVLEFDHLRDKKFNISERAGMYTLEAIMPEIEKCEIVCANCHKIRTATRAGWYSYD